MICRKKRAKCATTHVQMCRMCGRGGNSTSTTAAVSICAKCRVGSGNVIFCVTVEKESRSFVGDLLQMRGEHRQRIIPQSMRDGCGCTVDMWTGLILYGVRAGTMSWAPSALFPPHHHSPRRRVRGGLRTFSHRVARSWSNSLPILATRPSSPPPAYRL